MGLLSRLVKLLRREVNAECAERGHEWAAYGDPTLQRPHQGGSMVGGGHQPNAGYRRRCTRCGLTV